MDVFTDVDIFKEVVGASLRGVPVYILLDDFHVKSFLTMAENQDVNIRQMRVSAHWETTSWKGPLESGRTVKLGLIWTVFGMLQHQNE